MLTLYFSSRESIGVLSSESKGVTQTDELKPTLYSTCRFIDSHTAPADGQVHVRPPESALVPDATAFIHALPVEILSTIFVLAQVMLDSGPSKASCFPLIISTVSRFWRNVALGTALLWKGLYLSPPWRLNSDMITTYLNRSGSYPIDLFFSTATTGVRPPCLDVDRLYTLLVPYLARCRTISMIGDRSTDSTVLGLLQMLSQSALPLVERFSVELGESTYKKTSCDLDTPSLKELRLYGCNLLFNVPMDGITTLHLAVRISHSRFREALTVCRALKVLAIYDNHIYDWPVPSAPQPLPLNSLMSLQIYGDMQAVPELLFSLGAPNLTDLSVTPVVAEDFMALSRYLGSCSTKFPSLRTLTLAPHRPYSYKALPIASKLFPTVEHFTLVTMEDRPFALTFINLVEGNILFPHLSKLALRAIDCRTEALLIEMIEFRKAQGYALRLLQIDPQSVRGMHRSLSFLKTQVEVEVCDVWDIRMRGALSSAGFDRLAGF